MSNPDNRAELLFFSPHVPARSGHGASMRAGAHLEVLARHFKVHLVLLIPEGTTVAPVEDDFIPFHSASVQIIRVPAFPVPRSTVEVIFDALAPLPRLVREYPERLADSIVRGLPTGHRVGCMHVFRLGLVRLAEAVARQLRLDVERIVVDMDDFESESAARALRLEGSQIGRVLTAARALDIHRLRRLERWASRRYRYVVLCSDTDRDKFIARYPGSRVSVVPNAYRIPEQPLSAWAGDVPTILFVGSLNYMPNVDALAYFTESIWARYLSGRGYRMIVAGRQPGYDVRTLCAANGFTLIANPPEIEAVYQAASLLVVPIRTGGGTRIKILESFGLGRPVVSTRIGAEGIDVEDGVHILLADEPAAFAAACQRVIEDSCLARGLVDRARGLVEQHYSLNMVASRMEAVYGGFGSEAGVEA